MLFYLPDDTCILVYASSVLHQQILKFWAKNTATPEAMALLHSSNGHVITVMLCVLSLGPFHGNIAVPSVTRCRCRRRRRRWRRRHRCAGGARQYR